MHVLAVTFPLIKKKKKKKRESARSFSKLLLLYAAPLCAELRQLPLCIQLKTKSEKENERAGCSLPHRRLSNLSLAPLPACLPASGGHAALGAGVCRGGPINLRSPASPQHLRKRKGKGRLGAIMQ